MLIVLISTILLARFVYFYLLEFAVLKILFISLIQGRDLMFLTERYASCSKLVKFFSPTKLIKRCQFSLVSFFRLKCGRGDIGRAADGTAFVGGRFGSGGPSSSGNPSPSGGPSLSGGLAAAAHGNLQLGFNQHYQNSNLRNYLSGVPFLCNGTYYLCQPGSFFPNRIGFPSFVVPNVDANLELGASSGLHGGLPGVGKTVAKVSFRIEINFLSINIIFL